MSGSIVLRARTMLELSYTDGRSAASVIKGLFVSEPGVA